jgi:hypothetical protein
LTDALTQREIGSYITSGNLPADPNALYLVLPDSNNSVSAADGSRYCSTWCGYNNNASIAGTNIKYAVVGDATGCGNCQWGLHTPNDVGGADTNGALDGELSAIAHELVERITDPLGGGGGWRSSGTGGNTQNADFCSWANGNVPIAEGNAYTTIANSGSYAQANFRGISTDFLLQTLRVNARNGGFGYCVNSYGGVFWGQDYGVSHSGDWDYGNYKGMCEQGQPVIGLSEDTSTTPKAHAVMCGSSPNAYLFGESSCRLLTFDGSAGTVQWYSDPPPVGDWDWGYYKGECGQSEYVAGVAQSTSGVVNGLYCCTGNVRHASCEAVPFDSGNLSSYDWDYGYYKAECNNGQYVAGVSAVTTSGTPHKVFCCYP